MQDFFHPELSWEAALLIMLVVSTTEITCGAFLHRRFCSKICALSLSLSLFLSMCVCTHTETTATKGDTILRLTYLIRRTFWVRLLDLESFPQPVTSGYGSTWSFQNWEVLLGLPHHKQNKNIILGSVFFPCLWKLVYVVSDLRVPLFL